MKSYIAIIIIIVLLIIMIIVTNNYINYCTFHIYLSRLSKQNIPYQNGNQRVLVHFKKINISLLMKSDRVNIQCTPKNLLCNYILVEDLLILTFRYTYSFIPHVRVKPILIKLSDKKSNAYKLFNLSNKKIIAQKDIEINSNKIVLRVDREVNDILTIEISDNLFDKIKKSIL